MALQMFCYLYSQPIRFAVLKQLEGHSLRIAEMSLSAQQNTSVLITLKSMEQFRLKVMI